MKKIIVLASTIIAYSHLSSAACETENRLIEKGATGCGPKREFVPVANDISGMYMKTSPKGDYLITSGPTGLIDLTSKGDCGETKFKFIPSPMNSEVAPVEGSEWRLLASPNHQNGMRYFKLDDILSKQQGAQEDFNDQEHNQYYQSAAELEGSTADTIKFRTVLYTGGRARDYEATKDSSGKWAVTKKSEITNLCQNFVTPGQTTSPEQERTNLRISELSRRISEIERIYSRASEADQALLSAEYRTLSDERVRLGGGRESMSNPVLSKDGKEISFVGGPKYSFKIAKILNGSDCQIVEDLGVQGSKGSFSLPVAGKKGLFVYSGYSVVVTGADGRQRTESGVYVLNRDTGKTTKVSSGNGGNYPGITKDGRVIFMSQFEGRRALEIVDTNQLEGGDVSKCAKPTASATSGSGGTR